MDNKILPNEVHVLEHGALIQTRCPKDHITDEMIHQRVIATNLGVGDIVRVQCTNHAKDTVLWFAEYLVYSRNTELKRVEVSDRETRHTESVSYAVLLIRDWQATPAVKAETKGKTKAA